MFDKLFTRLGSAALTVLLMVARFSFWQRPGAHKTLPETGLSTLSIPPGLPECGERPIP